MSLAVPSGWREGSFQRVVGFGACSVPERFVPTHSKRGEPIWFSPFAMTVSDLSFRFFGNHHLSADFGQAFAFVGPRHIILVADVQVEGILAGLEAF